MRAPLAVRGQSTSKGSSKAGLASEQCRRNPPYPMLCEPLNYQKKKFHWRSVVEDCGNVFLIRYSLCDTYPTQQTFRISTESDNRRTYDVRAAKVFNFGFGSNDRYSLRLCFRGGCFGQRSTCTIAQADCNQLQEHPQKKLRSKVRTCTATAFSTAHNYGHIPLKTYHPDNILH